MKGTTQLKGVYFAQHSSKSTTPTAKKQVSSGPVLESEKTTERIYNKLSHRSSQAMQQKTMKTRPIETSIPYQSNSPQTSLKEQNELTRQNQEIGKLKAEIETIRNNHRQEIEFYLNQELNMAVNVEKLLVSKQYRRLLAFVEHQIHDIRRRMDNIFGANEEKTPSATSLCMESGVCEDLQLKSLTEHLQENIQEIGIENVGILPQIKKLLSETELSTKRLSWYFSKVPFDLPSKEVCNSLASRLIEDLGCSTGSEVMKVIVSSAKSQSQAIELEDSDSSISKIIQRHSLCIL